MNILWVSKSFMRLPISIMFVLFLILTLSSVNCQNEETSSWSNGRFTTSRTKNPTIGERLLLNAQIFGSDRSPRCQDVRVCVCLCDIMLKGTVKEFWRVKMSSSSILKHPGGSRASKQAGK